jgi:hypothetical protein
MKTIFYPLRRSIFLFFAVVLAIATNAQTFRFFNTGTEFPSGGAGGVEANINLGPTGIVTGLKFRVTQGGTVDAIHFYKGTTNTVANIVTLWNINGTSLGTATLPADAVSGWRTVTLGTPVAITAGTTYMVTAFNASGILPASSGGLTSNDFTARPPFIIIGGGSSAADPANPGNGMRESTNSSTVMPTFADPSLYNYWVDLDFTTFFPLPARLTDFNAAATNRDVVLTWKTGSEQNNKGFEIQRSNNGAEWYPIGFVNGAGESSTTRNYTYTDRSLSPGNYYYRLEQKDFDGNSAKSSIVTAAISGRGAAAISTGQNPFITSTNIRVDLPSKQKIRLSVIDLNGREIRVLADNVREAGTHQVLLNADGLNRQLYYIRLQTETETLVKKIIVQ